MVDSENNRVQKFDVQKCHLLLGDGKNRRTNRISPVMWLFMKRKTRVRSISLMRVYKGIYV